MIVRGRWKQMREIEGAHGDNMKQGDKKRETARESTKLTHYVIINIIK